MLIIVLNLVISGIPSILDSWGLQRVFVQTVLNLVISGIPSILGKEDGKFPLTEVLNLVISGIPSIQSMLVL